MSLQEDEGFPRPVKLRLIELVGLGLLVAGGVRIALGGWALGLPMLVLGAFVLLYPTKVADLIERFLPRE